MLEKADLILTIGPRQLADLSRYFGPLVKGYTPE
jgi:hypothetical protein